MLNFDRLSGDNGCIELGFVEREATPEPAMALGIRLYLAGLSLSNTIFVFDRLGVERCRSTAHNWVQKADLQPLDGANPDHVAVDEAVIQLDDERYWLYAVTRTRGVLVGEREFRSR
jgi:transposase-like protein